jgi:Domain of unknown function (DUF4412)
MSEQVSYQRVPSVNRNPGARSRQDRRPSERATGIEPAWPAWKAGTLPLSYARILVPAGSTAGPARTAKLPCPRRSAKRFLARDCVCYFSVSGLASPMRNFVLGFAAVGLAFLCSARADLTIVQRVEGVAQNGNVTVKIKGDMQRIDAPSQPTRIIDGKTGEMTDLINDQKSFVKISAAQIKAAAASMSLSADKKSTASKLTPTGKKETINGYETEEYVYETPQFKASFWVANKYPGAADILKQMQKPISGAWKPSNMGLPDYTDFSGMPLKTVISVGESQVATTIVSVKQDPLNANEFEIPKDFQPLKEPDQSGSRSGAPSTSSTP